MLHDTTTHLSAPSRAHYRWTLARQRAFLEHFAISGCVSHAANHVGVSPRAAYDLRHRRDGLLFGLGWGAAVLLARYRLTDLLLERAIDGVEEVAVRTSDREDGSAEVRRRKFDGRLGMAMLARLDRMAGAMAGPATEDSPEEAALYRAVAQDFESFLDRLSPPPEREQPPEPAAQAASSAPETAAPSGGPHVAPAHAAAEAITLMPAYAAAATAEQAAAYAELAADARADAQARITAHLAANANRPSPLGRLAQESGVHCELAEKTADTAVDEKEAASDWVPPKPTPERERELQTQIHDLLDKIEDQRAAAGLNAIDIRWDSCVLAQAFHELAKMDEEKLMPFGAFLRAELAPYGAAWRELDPADTDPDSEFARLTAPNNMFDSVELRREDSIKSRIDRLMAVGKARAVPVEAEERAEAED